MNYGNAPYQPQGENPTAQPNEPRPNPFYGVYKGVYCFIVAYLVFGLWIFFLIRTIGSILMVIDVVTDDDNDKKALISRAITQLVFFIVIWVLDANGRYMGAIKQ
ncbi:uncharacterized protein VICG_00142 [Vittaforma corneae ATCC 50505]|uniref:Uncharacterized protein n=1 Tax=Vittaforma corneae (strain ATCC 50505) TaxID=993615 RepID=L2GR74_VITCO|nr:uncharacterized protein VICG_00142 [Vittaforma corneae ATCC 50505]ELA42827.1 hypothetical protein VICG_00142 [Vittaforma corneae ATCC 50505]